MPALTQKGQVTVPIDVRRFLGIQTGDEVEFVVNRGRVEIQRTTQGHRSAYGVLSPRNVAATRPEGDDAELMEALLEEDDRIRGACK